MTIHKSTHSIQQLPLFNPVVIKLTQGYEAMVDPIDADLAEFNWTIAGRKERNNVYAVREANEKVIRMHVVTLARMLNRPLAKSEEVDHIDGNHFNNCRNNLRLASRSQNMANQKLRKTSKSGYKGVSWHKHAWMAQIQVQGKKIYLGLFDTPEEAHQAYCAAARTHFGDFFRPE